MTKERQTIGVPGQRHPHTQEAIDIFTAIIEGRIKNVSNGEVARGLEMGVTTVWKIQKNHGLLNQLREVRQNEFPPEAVEPHVIFPRLKPPELTGKQKVIEIVNNVLLTRSKPPSIDDLSDESGLRDKGYIHEILHERGLTEKLRALRESPELVYPPSKETAWFIGALFGSGGSFDLSRKEIALRAEEEDTGLVNAFKSTGVELFSDEDQKKQVYEKVHNGKTTVSIHTIMGVRALGDFTLKGKVQSIKERHSWVLSELYTSSFLSGIVDSGGYIDTKKGTLSLYAKEEGTIDFLLDTLRSAGVSSEVLLLGTVRGIITRKLTETKKLASLVQLRSSLKRKQLDQVKQLPEEKRKRRFANPESAEEIVTEWERLMALNDGVSMASYRIDELYKNEGTLFPSSIYKKYFGGDSKRNFVAKQRLDEIVAMDPEERVRVLSDIRVARGTTKATEAELLAEWLRMHKDGIQPTQSEIRKKHRLGETPYSPTLYMRKFGILDDGKSTSFERAVEVLQAKIAEQNETDVYP